MIPMRNERIVFGQGECGRTIKPACDVVIPDVRWLGLCLDRQEGIVLFWAFGVACQTLDKIIHRQRWLSVNEGFEIDVPDLRSIADHFPQMERTLVLDFGTT